jgi:lysophospholipase L1-like esterase
MVGKWGTNTLVYYDKLIFTDDLSYTVRINHSGTNGSMYLYFCYADASNYYAVRLGKGTDLGLELIKVSSGVTAVLATAESNYANPTCFAQITFDDSGAITVSYSESTSTPSYTELINYTDATPLPGGKIGCGWNAAAGGGWFGAFAVNGQAYDPAQNVLKEETVSALDKTVARRLGRTYANGQSLRLAHSLTGVEFNATGTKKIEVYVSDLSGTGKYINVRIDGGAYSRVELTEADWNTVAEFDAPESHTVKIVISNEAMHGNIDISQIKITGTKTVQPAISASAPKARKIEVIGDSITASSGILGNNPMGSLTADNQDASLSYANLAADALNADLNVVAVTGIGVLKSVKSLNEAVAYAMPERYNYQSYYEGERNNNNLWDFGEYVPDVIVVNLGTNDSSNKNTENLKNAFTDFIEQIRAKNVDKTIPIIMSLGSMSNDVATDIQYAVNKARLSDPNVYWLPYSYEAGQGELEHPNAAQHATMAALLTAKIKEVSPLSLSKPVLAGNVISGSYEITSTSPLNGNAYIAAYDEDNKLIAVHAAANASGGNYALTVGNGEPKTLKLFVFGGNQAPLTLNRALPIE